MGKINYVIVFIPYGFRGKYRGKPHAVCTTGKEVPGGSDILVES